MRASTNSCHLMIREMHQLQFSDTNRVGPLQSVELFFSSEININYRNKSISIYQVSFILAFQVYVVIMHICKMYI